MCSVITRLTIDFVGNHTTGYLWPVLSQLLIPVGQILVCDLPLNIKHLTQKRKLCWAQLVQSNNHLTSYCCPYPWERITILNHLKSHYMTTLSNIWMIKPSTAKNKFYHFLCKMHEGWPCDIKDYYTNYFHESNLSQIFYSLVLTVLSLLSKFQQEATKGRLSDYWDLSWNHKSVSYHDACMCFVVVWGMHALKPLLTGRVPEICG